MKKQLSIEEKEYIIDKYTTTGIPDNLIIPMCKELGISDKKLYKWLAGQTCGLIGNTPIIYPWDVKRYVNKLPVVD